MVSTPSGILLDEITDFLAASPSPQEIVSFKPSEELARRSLELLDKNRDGQLTPEEQTEFEAFMQMEHFLTILKAKARLKLSNQP